MAESFMERINKHNNHTPDVLSCLANLSNDEVFTPPEVVNKMLDMLPEELFQSKETKFLDPACKTGVFLREIAKRLINYQIPLYKDKMVIINEKKRIGMKLTVEDEMFLDNLQHTIDHIFKNQLYGIAITELTSLLSRRSVYCSKYPNGPYSIVKFDNAEGNIRFRKTTHLWQNGKCVFCSASKAIWDRVDILETYAYEFIHTLKPEETFHMKFDVIIGNPPYQLDDGGNGSSAKPIYHLFIEQAKKLNPKYLSMIVPARWYAGGKGLDDFRRTMLNDRKISKIVDYPNPKDCFPGLNISGGVCYFLRNRAYDGDCEFTNVIGENYITEVRKMNEYDYFIRYNSAVSIVHKVTKISNSMLEEIITSRKPFGIDSYIRGEKKRKYNSDLILISSAGRGFVNKDIVTNNFELVNAYKVIIGKALSGHIGETDDNGQVKVLAKIETLKPSEVCTESYLCVGKFEKKEFAINLEKYLKTKFCRFLLLQALSSMNITKDKFCFVPLQDFSKPWTDEELYKKYNLTQEEINFIESMIKPME